MSDQHDGLAQERRITPTQINELLDEVKAEREQTCNALKGMKAGLKWMAFAVGAAIVTLVVVAYIVVGVPGIHRGLIGKSSDQAKAVSRESIQRSTQIDSERARNTLLACEETRTRYIDTVLAANTVRPPLDEQERALIALLLSNLAPARVDCAAYTNCAVSTIKPCSPAEIARSRRLLSVDDVLAHAT